MSTEIVLSDTGAKFEAWEAAFRKAAPALTLVPDQGDRALTGIRYCTTWKPRAGIYDRMPDLAALFVLGAGVERFLADASIPPAVQIVKMAEPGLTQAMEHYVLWQVIAHHRGFRDLEAAQREARWIDQTYPAPWARKVGVMGLGSLGVAVAAVLRDFGFATRGWSRSRKAIDGVSVFAGAEEMDAFLDGLEILVCLLPLTPETAGILSAELFAQLPEGAGLVHVGRGQHLDHDALLDALDSGHLSGAVLDVTEPEPLPADHRFWAHPRVILTPHIASKVEAAPAARAVVENLRRHRSGLPPIGLVDRSRGY